MVKKSLSLIVPCFNSEDYMQRCINSLLVGGAEVEIIIVNDGSTDGTSAIANHYQAIFPQQVKVIHQANSGHGGAINAGLAAATGIFCKVVDSDDWLEVASYRQVLKELSGAAAGQLDMMITNYVYENQGKEQRTVIHYRRFLPVGRLFTWEEARLPVGKYLLMHAIIYRTALLKKAQLQLPTHCFYVDNLFAFEPLPLVRRMYYLDANLYRYHIGRQDQSVNERVMIHRISQQLKVNKAMVEYYLWIRDIPLSILAYMRSYLGVVTAVSSILLIRDGSAESLAEKRALWQFIRSRDARLYYRLRLGVLGLGVHLPGRLGRKASIGVYRIAQRIIGFN